MSDLDTIGRHHGKVARGSVANSVQPDLEIERLTHGGHVPGFGNQRIPPGRRVWAAVAAAGAVLVVGGIPLLLSRGSTSVLTTPEPTSVVTTPEVETPLMNGDVLVFIDMAESSAGPLRAIGLDGVLSDELHFPDTGLVDDISWSPNGQELAYSNSGLWIANTTSGTTRRLDSSCRGRCGIAWSPTGTSIAVTNSYGQLELIDSTDETAAPMSVPLEGGVGASYPTWSPDGEWIVFSTGTRLAKVRPDGSDLTILLETTSRFGVVSPVWPSGGARIAYLTMTDTEQTDVIIMTVGADGSNPTELANIGRCYCLGFWPGLTASPDGTQVAFNSPEGLGVINIDGTGRRSLGDEGGKGNPAWRPIP